MTDLHAQDHSAPRVTVDFWFDPICEWSWMASRWILSAAEVRAIEVRWHVMSLAYLQSEKDGLSEESRQQLRAGWGPALVCIAAQETHGDKVLLPLYTAMGSRFHPEGKPKVRATMEDALVAVGLPANLVEAAEAEEFDAALKVSHHQGMGRVGFAVGPPIISVEGVAFFGPAVSPAPQGEAAGSLWDGILALAVTDGFFELKRSRTRKPDFS